MKRGPFLDLDYMEMHISCPLFKPRNHDRTLMITCADKEFCACLGVCMHVCVCMYVYVTELFFSCTSVTTDNKTFSVFKIIYFFH